MNANGSHNGYENEGLGTAEVDEVLEGLRPRMRTARIRHVRFMGAVVAAIPVLGFGLISLGQDATGDQVAVSSSQPDESLDAVGTERVGTDIGDAEGDAQATRAENDEERKGDEPDAESQTGSEEEEEAPEAGSDAVHEVEIDVYGTVDVKVGDDGVVLVRALISEPWTLLTADTNSDGDLVIAVIGEERVKLITIAAGLWGELHVELGELEIPTTTTTTTTTTTAPPPEPEPEPAPRVDRIVLEVPPAGSFVVEREGETLWGGNIQPNEGFGYDVVNSEGWKVHVAFFDETTVYHGKAYIDDNGELRTDVWSEPREVAAEPVYQWVEISGVGAVRFKLHDGVMYVKEITAAEGFEPYVYNHEGETVKVDFEGEGQLWIVEAWGVEGTIQWSTAGPNP